MLTFTAQELAKAKLDQEIIGKVKLQVEKDFQLYDESFHLVNADHTAYEDLFYQLLPIIDRMLNLDSARFFSLLYTIDIQEQQVKELIFGEQEIDASKELTHLILERELLKVLSRIYYKAKMNI